MELNHDLFFQQPHTAEGSELGLISSEDLPDPWEPQVMASISLPRVGAFLNIQNMYNVKLTLLWVKKYT